MGCIFGLLDYLLIKSWIWLLFFFFDSLKYMVMVVVSIFVGPGKTIHRLALSNTIRKIGWEEPNVYKVERAKVILMMLWATFIWLLPIAGYLSTVLSEGVS